MATGTKADHYGRAQTLPRHGFLKIRSQSNSQKFGSHTEV